MNQFGATRRIVPLTVAAFLAGVIAMWAESWVPAMALVPIVGILVASFAEVLLPLPRAGLRRHPPKLLVGDEGRIHIQVERRWLPQNLALYDQLPRGLIQVPRGQRRFRPKGRHLHASYAVRATRIGEVVFEEARVARVSALGLFRHGISIPIVGSMTVLPPTAHGYRLRLQSRSTGPIGQVNSLVRRGAGDEFYALREYQPGDPPGDVNWKASARMARLITNEYLPDEPPSYTLYLDTRAFGSDPDGMTDHADVFERTLEAGAGLSDALLNQQARVGMVLLSYWSSYVVPASGRKQAQRLRRMILDCRPGDDASIETLVRAGAPFIPSRSEAILLTSNAYDPTIGSAVAFLHRKHGRATVLSPAFPEPAGESEVLARTAGSLLNAELEAALASVRGLAERVLLWRDDEPLDVVLSRMGMGRLKR